MAFNDPIKSDYIMVIFSQWYLTHKMLDMHGCILSTVATDALVLKHQAISIDNAEQISIASDQIQTKTLHLWWAALENEIQVGKKMTQLFEG